MLSGSFGGQGLMRQELLPVPPAKWALQSHTVSSSRGIIQQPLSDTLANAAHVLCLFYTKKGAFLFRKEWDWPDPPHPDLLRFDHSHTRAISLCCLGERAGGCACMMGTPPHLPGFPAHGNAHVLGEESSILRRRREGGSRLPHHLRAAGSSHKPGTERRLLKIQTEPKRFCSLKTAAESGAGDGDARGAEGTCTGRRPKGWVRAPESRVPGGMKPRSCLRTGQCLPHHNSASSLRQANPLPMVP